MKRTSKTDRKRQTIFDAAVEKSLLHLHAAIHVESFWKAVQRIIEAAIPDSFVGLTLQHNPILPMITKWTRPVANKLVDFKPLEFYLEAHPRSKFVRTSDVFPNRSKLMKSGFYRQYMAPQKCLYATALFFWKGQRLICVIVIMRTGKQGALNRGQMNLLRRLYPQFQTALRRLGLLEREHFARKAFEQFLRRLPLPTMLLRWDLQLVYQNQAARKFCGVWEKGPEMARLMKANAPPPSEILNGCRALKKNWQQSPHLNVSLSTARQEIVHHPKRPHLRATISLKQLGSVGVTRPHFLIECEESPHGFESRKELGGARLPHLARLTSREQQLTRLVCDGRSNQEIADDAALSLAMVKKHLHTIFHKLEVASRSQLMALMR
jgi:DNA-binding CsgD family transcriptional regulator